MKKLGYVFGFSLISLLVGCTQQTQAPVVQSQIQQGPAKYVTYTVQRGDSLSGIASRYQMNYLALAQLNNIAPPYMIRVGQVLKVPNPQLIADVVAKQQQEYGGDIQPVNTQNSIPAQNLNLSQYGATSGKVYVAPQPVQGTPTTSGNANARAIANQLVTQTNAPANQQTNAAVKQSMASSSVKQTSAQAQVAAQASTQAVAQTSGKNVTTDDAVINDQVTWSWPVSGKLTEAYGEGSGLFAKGIQIVTAPNAKIHAAAAGTVIYSGKGVSGYGNMVIIKSDNNFLTAYTNLSSLLVKQGQAVKRGDTVGVVGTINGKPTLHFEVRKFGNPVNPEKYLP